MAPIAENLATAALTVLALALLVIALRAWQYAHSGRVLWLALGFALFLLKGLLYSVALFRSTDWSSGVALAGVTLDVAILLAFYVAVLRRTGPA